MSVARLMIADLPAPAPAAHMGRENGHAWTIFLTIPEPGDDRAEIRRSRLIMLEDGRPLGPAHAVHDDIRRLGRGRFSHWGDRIYFSTSDNSDPRSNGRRYELAVGATEIQEMPSVMHVALTSACNLTCRTCRTDNLNRSSLDDRVIDKIIDQIFPTLSELRLDVAGEPTLHKAKFLRIMEGARRHNVAVFMCTNAMLIDDELAKSICANPAMSKIQLSLDSTDPQLLQWIRRGADLQGITAAVRRLTTQRKALGRDDLSFNLHAALLSNNIDELPDFVRYCSQEGVESFSTMFGFIQRFLPMELSVFWDKQRHNDRVAQAARLAADLGIDFNNWGLFDIDAPAIDADFLPSKRIPCHYLSDWTLVHANGQVGPCCLAAGFPLGDMATLDFAEIWRGKAYEDLRRTHTTDHPTNPKCAACYNRLGWDKNSYRPYFDPSHWPAVRRRLGLDHDD